MSTLAIAKGPAKDPAKGKAKTKAKPETKVVHVLARKPKAAPRKSMQAEGTADFNPYEMSAAKARRLARSAGIITKSGNLTRAYK